MALTAPYMHDGRFATLNEVIDHYDHGVKVSRTLSPLIFEADNAEKSADDPIGLNLQARERQALLAFLGTLTDDDFVTNIAFSNPGVLTR